MDRHKGRVCMGMYGTLLCCTARWVAGCWLLVCLCIVAAVVEQTMAVTKQCLLCSHVLLLWGSFVLTSCRQHKRLHATLSHF
jgi:hypothetical protein